jgi:hypothetical protein
VPENGYILPILKFQFPMTVNTEWSILHSLNRFQQGKSLSSEDRISLLSLTSLVLVLILILLSLIFNPRSFQEKIKEKRKSDRRKRPWKLLSYFFGVLFPERQISDKQSRLNALQRLALSDDLYSQSAACSELVGIADDLAIMTPKVLSEDLYTLCRMSAAPAAAVAQRIPICLALLCCSPENRERLCSLPPTAIRSVVAGARAASRLKQAGAAMAALALAQSANAAATLVRMGILEPLGAMLDDRRSGGGGDSDGRRLAAALALARLAQRGGAGEDRRLFATQAFLRAVAALMRADDQRLQLCAASIFAALCTNEVPPLSPCCSAATPARVLKRSLRIH